MAPGQSVELLTVEQIELFVKDVEAEKEEEAARRKPRSQAEQQQQQQRIGASSTTTEQPGASDQPSVS